MEQPRGFVNLACPACGGTRFLPLVHLKHRPGSGLVPDPSGYACLACQEAVDPQAMLNAQSLQQKRDELKVLEQELGIEHAI